MNSLRGGGAKDVIAFSPEIISLIIHKSYIESWGGGQRQEGTIDKK